jgi:hypothetical protein
MVVTGINSGNFTALLTIICHRKENIFLFWRYCGGVIFSHLYKLAKQKAVGIFLPTEVLIGVNLRVVTSRFIALEFYYYK